MSGLEEAIRFQPRAAAALTAALRSGPSHAYLFEGPSGSGKRLAARAFAAEILAVGAPDAESARRRALLDPSPHPDLTWLEPSGATHLVEDVRESVIRSAALRPAEGRHRVFVICEAESLRDESQNALLKTLEEPAGFAHLVLVCSRPEMLLPTIASRCATVAFAPLPPEAICELAGLSGDEGTAAARLAAGDLEAARFLASEQGRSMRLQSEAAASAAVVAALGDPDAASQALRSEPWAPLLEAAEAEGERASAAEERRLIELGESSARSMRGSRGKAKLSKDATDRVKRVGRRARISALDTALGLCASWFRDLAAFSAGVPTTALNVDRSQALEASAEGVRPGAAAEAVALVSDTRRRLGLNVGEELALEALWLRLGAVLRG